MSEMRKCAASTPRGVCKFNAGAGRLYCGQHHNYFSRLNERISHSVVKIRTAGDILIALPSDLTDLKIPGWCVTVEILPTFESRNIPISEIESWTQFFDTEKYMFILEANSEQPELF